MLSTTSSVKTRLPGHQQSTRKRVTVSSRLPGDPPVSGKAMSEENLPQEDFFLKQTPQFSASHYSFHVVTHSNQALDWYETCLVIIYDSQAQNSKNHTDTYYKQILFSPSPAGKILISSRISQRKHPASLKKLVSCRGIGMFLRSDR